MYVQSPRAAAVAGTLDEGFGAQFLFDLNERFGYGMPEDEDYDTLGGFVITRFGRIPVQGESLEWDQWRFQIDAADKRRVRRLRIESRVAEQAGESAADDSDSVG